VEPPCGILRLINGRWTCQPPLCQPPLRPAYFSHTSWCHPNQTDDV